MKYVKLGNTEYFQIIIGQSPESESYNKDKDGLPFYQGKTDFGLLNPIPTVWCNSPTRIAEKGDILMSVRAPVGPVNIASETCCIGRGLAAIRPKTNIHNKYVYWVLRDLESVIAESGNGSMFNSITKDQVFNISIPLPADYNEQIRITNYLDSQITKIEHLRIAFLTQLEAANKLTASILNETFNSFKAK
jgi:type I restriction enzyme, S subunit